MKYRINRARKALVLCAVLCTGGGMIIAQEGSELVQTNTTGLGSMITNKMFVGFGPVLSVFQDARYSGVPYSGAGIDLRIGYKKVRDDRYWQIELLAQSSKESAATHNLGPATVLQGGINGRYMVDVAPGFMVGARLDLMDVCYRKVEGLSNNSSQLINGANLYVSGEYKRVFNENWTLNTGLDLGFLSYMEDGLSFGFSASQNVLDGGDFDYQDKAQNTISLKYYRLESFGKLLNLRTHVSMRLKERITFSYHWRLFNFTETKSYPLTRANHSLTISYRIKNKQKQKSVKGNNENTK